MKVLFVLLAAFLLALPAARLVSGVWQPVFAGNAAMCIMLCFTASGHFMYARGMAMMVPDFVPLKQEAVFWSGIAEILLGIALLFPSSRQAAGIALILLLLLLLPANIRAALLHIDYAQADHNGPGPAYLWLRIPLQLLFIGWVWYFALSRTGPG